MLCIYKKVIFQSFIFLVSIGYLVTAVTIGRPVVDESIQPSFFPLILGFFAVLFSGILFFNELIAVRSNKVTGGKGDDCGGHRFAIPIVIFSIFLYIMTFSIVGYFISSAFFVFAMMLVFSSKGNTVKKAAISVVIATLGYLVFELLFGVRLPALWG